MANGIIEQIKVGENICDLVALSAKTASKAYSASSIGAVTVFDEAEGDKTYKGLFFQNGAKTGHVDLNSKGNMTIESLSKHVNVEAAAGIQMKPTTNIAFDSSRRILANNGNEVHLEARFDDYSNFTAGTASEYEGKVGNDEQWAELKFSARNMDFRCNDHGGIALQPCGKDGSGHENKIKFESSRTSVIGAVDTYVSTGGKGLEFGTFNNLHTSIYTGDYRFKGDAKVYGVTRGVPTTTSTGKVDYPTQGDDFKDILLNKDGQNCVWDETTQKWVEPLGASWTEIVKVARNYADGKIGGGGSVDPEIYATKAWVGEQEFLNKTTADGYYSEKNEYIKYIGESDKGSLQIDNTTMPEKPNTKGVLEPANINFITNGNLSFTAGSKTLATSATSGKFEVLCGGKFQMESKKSGNLIAGTDMSISAGEDSNIEMSSKKIKLSNNISGKEAMVESVSGLTLGVTPFVNLSVKKFDDDRSFINTNPEIGFVFQNGYRGDVYYDATNKKAFVPIEMTLEDTTVYFSGETEAYIFDPAVAYTKQKGYTNAELTDLLTPSVDIVVKSVTDNQYYDVAVTKNSEVKTGATVHSFVSPDPFIEYVDIATWEPTEGLKKLGYGDTVKIYDSINLAELRELMAIKDSLKALADRKDDLLALLS